MDLLLSRSMPAPQRRPHVESVYTDSSSNKEVSSKHDDALSISASGKFSELEDGVDENNNVSHENLSENTKKCLFDIFGEYAVVSKKPTQKIGIATARLGIVMQLYIQQALGNLAEHFQSENFSRDEGLDQIRNIFSMTTKCLDEIGRAGAFHHIIRRTVKAFLVRVLKNYYNQGKKRKSN